jgi:hypothetical protein
MEYLTKISTMQNLKEIVEELNSLVEEQKWDEKLNRFYDENVTSADEGETTIGLPAMKKGLEDFVTDTSDVKLALKNVIVSDDMSVTDWHYIFKQNSPVIIFYSVGMFLRYLAE